MLAEARKYKLSIFLTQQYIEHLHEKIRSAIFGNIGTLISFRVGSAAAEYLSKEFYPNFSASDLITFPKYSMELKLMIDGATSIPFRTQTVFLSPFRESFRTSVIVVSRKQYAKKKNVVESELFRRYERLNDQSLKNTLF